MLVLTAVCCWLLYPFKNFKPYSGTQNDINILNSSALSSSENCFFSLFHLQTRFWCRQSVHVVPENIHTSRMEGRSPSALWKFQLNFIHFFKFIYPSEPSTPGNSNPFFWGSVDIFWNSTMVP